MLTNKVLVGANVPIPRITHKREFEQLIELGRQYFLCRDGCRVARQLRANPVTGQMTETIADELRNIERIPITEARKCGPNTRATRFGYMNKQELEAMREKHWRKGRKRKKCVAS